MPDANGNVKGISVPRVPWHEPKQFDSMEELIAELDSEDAAS
jgi:hypothetical protein